jgi:elongation factor 1-gamma
MLKLFADTKTDAVYRAWKVLIAAEYSGVEIEVPTFDVKEAATAEFKKKSPSGKLPVLETANATIFEANAIARYVAKMKPEAQLFGDSFVQGGKVEQWIEWGNNELEPARNTWLLPVFGFLEYDPQAYKEATHDVKNCMAVLNDHLLSHTFMVGQHVTLADIVLVSALGGLFANVFDSKYLSNYPNVVRWFETCINQPQFAKVIGKVEFAKEEKKAVVKAGKKEKKEKAEKADKPKKEAPKKEEKPKEKPKEKKENKEDDLGDDEEKPVKKAPNPLDLLPPSPTGMNMDTTKRTFFNQKPFNPEFFAWFWPQFDGKGFVFYTSKYNYDNDNTVLYMTSNLVGGFIQRCDDVRKYAWGVVNILGKNEDEGPFKLSGAWLFRGTEIPKEMKEVPDADGYTWTKVDVSTPEGKKIIEQEYTADKLAGDAVLDRKYFK